MKLLKDEWKSSQQTFISLQMTLQILFDVFGFGRRSVTFDGNSGFVDQEFGEIPFDRIEPKKSALLVLQPLVEGVRVIALTW